MVNTEEVLTSEFVIRWKERMRKVLKASHPEAKEKKIEKYLNKLVLEKFVERDVVLINNYTNQLVKTTLSATLNLIQSANLIIGGDGVLYRQHDEVDNVLVAFISHIKSMRNAMKKERKKYPKDSYEWLMCDISQSNYKKLINSLYGVMGYIKFILSNRFIAQSVTNQGRQIICSAVCCFENFLSDNMDFVTMDELVEYIMNIRGEYEEKYAERGMDLSIFAFDGDLYDLVKQRLLKKCGFLITVEEVAYVEKLLAPCTREELILLYYKNNLLEFNELPFIKRKLDYIVGNIDELNSPDHIADLPKDVRDAIDDIMDFYQIMVVYNYPVYDRVRKAMFTDKKAVLYVDTDSNFLGLAPLVRHTIQHLSPETVAKTLNNRILRRIIVNIFTCYCQIVVNQALTGLAQHMNIRGEWENIFSMKNEFYNERIVFTDKKKRYIALPVIQEGSILNDGEGIPDIKGFDFKKSTTKQFVKEYYTNLCVEYILKPNVINVGRLYHELMRFRNEISKGIKSGDTQYFKQASVNAVEHYKEPWSTQGITATYIWNIFNPDNMLELPGDCNIVPIKPLTANKRTVTQNINGKNVKVETLHWESNRNIIWLRENYPDYYNRFESGIMNNENPDIRKMSMSYMATPKNPEIPLPPFFDQIVDVEKILTDTLGLFLPIMESLGLRGQRVSSTTSYMSNIVKLQIYHFYDKLEWSLPLYKFIQY